MTIIEESATVEEVATVEETAISDTESFYQEGKEYVINNDLVKVIKVVGNEIRECEIVKRNVEKEILPEATNNNLIAAIKNLPLEKLTKENIIELAQTMGKNVSVDMTNKEIIDIIRE